VLVSLWDVEDESTAALMTRFYEAVLGKQHLSPAAALRRAQVEMWKSKHWAAPYYWAPFALHGEYR
jgi:CHAT domain-containing protein